MKVNWMTCALVPLLLGGAAAQQPASPPATNSPLNRLESTSAVEHYLRGCGRTNKWGDVRVEPIENRIADADKGDANAQFELALRYRDGAYAPKDRAEAAKWFKTAAHNGNLGAAYLLAWEYLYGDGKNPQEAVNWFRFAAKRGHLDSQGWLAAWLYSGGGGAAGPFLPEIEKNLPEAAKWCRRAAVQGDACAQLQLGRMYVEGEGVIQDFIEAYKWLNIASASEAPKFDHLPAGTREMLKQFPSWAEQARVARDTLAGQMTSSQIAEAQCRSREFVARKEIQGEGPGDGKEPIPADSTPRFAGTGFFITDDGFALTCLHVVVPSSAAIGEESIDPSITTKMKVVRGSQSLSAKLIQADKANDVALLKVTGTFKALPLVGSLGVKLGNAVFTVGFPNINLQGVAPKLAKGEIAALSGAQDDLRYFQISVPIQPGNSGGALIDERGNVVGVVSAKLNAGAALAASGALPENVNYAVKSSFLLSFLESVPEVSAKLKAPSTKERRFEDMVKAAQDAAVLVLVY